MSSEISIRDKLFIIRDKGNIAVTGKISELEEKLLGSIVTLKPYVVASLNGSRILFGTHKRNSIESYRCNLGEQGARITKDYDFHEQEIKSICNKETEELRKYLKISRNM